MAGRRGEQWGSRMEMDDCVAKGIIVSRIRCCYRSSLRWQNNSELQIFQKLGLLKYQAHAKPQFNFSLISHSFFIDKINQNSVNLKRRLVWLILNIFLVMDKTFLVVFNFTLFQKKSSLRLPNILK